MRMKRTKKKIWMLLLCLLVSQIVIGQTSLPRFHYYTKDYQGNNRVVVDETGTILQTTHYYPFGGVYADTGSGSADQHVGENGAWFEVRRKIEEFGVNVGDKIWVSYYKIESKN